MNFRLRILRKCSGWSSVNSQRFTWAVPLAGRVWHHLIECVLACDEAEGQSPFRRGGTVAPLTIKAAVHVELGCPENKIGADVKPGNDIAAFWQIIGLEPNAVGEQDALSGRKLLNGELVLTDDAFGLCQPSITGLMICHCASTSSLRVNSVESPSMQSRSRRSYASGAALLNELE